MSTNFKTCIFGGFDREDVISYIEKTANESSARIQELTDLVKSLQEENADLSSTVDTLREKAERFDETSGALETLRASTAELVRRAEELAAENETLRSQAQEFQSLKDHIAEIEISAHRRTEEFRANAIARIRELVADQQGWCAQRREQYAAAHDSVCRQLNAAREALGQEADLSGFDRMEEQLRELAESLDK